MPGIIYNADDLIDKTLIAAKDLAIYNGVPTKTYTPKEIGIVKSGNPVGVVFSYVEADPTNNQPDLWWIIWPGQTYGGQYFYLPHHVGDFSVDAIKQQGVLTPEEKAAAADEANKPWYQQVVDKIIPIGVGVIIASAVIKGLLSRKSQ